MQKLIQKVIHGLKEGINLININVTSEDETQNKLYTIQVTKTSNPELANTNLETLAIENVLLNPNFENNTTQYNAEVSNEITKLNILAIPENENANVQISGYEDIKEGDNKILISVTAQNGITKRDYQINVYRRNIQEEESYKEEQEKQKEALEHAYEIEKTSTTNEEAEAQQAEQEKKKHYLVWVLIGLLIIVCIIIGVIYYKKRKNNN